VRGVWLAWAVLLAVLGASCSGKEEMDTRVLVTFYGFVDNDPPGKAIAYQHRYFPDAVHDEAGGVGSYEDPITVAAKEGRWPIGTRMYVPYLKKYLVLEDTCANCREEHIDVWMESDGAFPDELLACEEEWTREQAEVEINPPKDREVDLKPFYQTSTGVCNQIP
jgi:3D (Asp-Asp-Asp) domain-containing protein